MINENRLIELLEDEILRIDTESTPGCGNLYGRDASVMRNTLNYVIDLINEQPKVNEWIPIKENEPSCNGQYLMFVRIYNKYGSEDKYIVADYYDGLFDVYPYIEVKNCEVEVLAWQPLPEFPEPYSSED